MAVILGLAILGSASAEERLKRIHHRQIHMGVQVRITLYAPDQATGDEACEAAFAKIAALEDVFSDYRPKSELNRLCGQAGGPPVGVSDELLDVLARAATIAERSDGAFDATVGPYVRLWRESRRTGRPLPRKRWRKAARRTGWESVAIDADAGTVQLLKPGMQLDLGGIAKGYALDAGLELLRGVGMPRALLSAGGDIAVGDPPPGRSGWRVRAWDADEEHAWLTVSNCGVSTSGDTEQFVEIDGRLHSHIIDPRSGIRYGDPLLATIVAPNAALSDALATACVVLGKDGSEQLLSQYPEVNADIRVATAPP